MRNQIDPFWLEILLMGFDEGDEGDEGDDADDTDDNDEDDDDNQEDKDEKDKGPNTEGLKTALRKERKLRRDAERELKRRDKEKTDQEEENESDKSKEEARRERTKSEKLANRLRRSEEDNVIGRFASRMNFVDLDDALRLVSREDFDVEQDEDDPSEIDIDETSVQEALKALAKKKPHLLKKDDDNEKDDEEDIEPRRPTGSKFSSKKKKSKDELDDATLKERYPMLR